MTAEELAHSAMTDTPYLTRAREFTKLWAPLTTARETDGGGYILFEDQLTALLMQVRNEALEEAANVAMERSLVCQDAVKTYERRKGEDENWKKYLVLSEGCAAREADHIERTIRSLKVSP